MSAFLVSDAHIDAIVSAAIHGALESKDWWPPYFSNPSKKCEEFNADALGEMLVRENEASMEARYPGRWGTPAPAYKYPGGKSLRPALGLLKLIQCYEYQTCEHEGWDTSDAAKLCTTLKNSLIRDLPGYDAQPWALD